MPNNMVLLEILKLCTHFRITIILVNIEFLERNNKLASLFLALIII